MRPVGIDRLRAWLPRGDTLDAGAFHQRHRTLSILLAAHLPVLVLFGVLRGQELLHAAGEVGFAGLLLGLAWLPMMPRRTKGILVSAGLVWCSAVAVHFSGGMIEAHFHFFVIIGFIALYQDWAAFGWAIVFTALSHGVGSALAPAAMFNHDAAIQRPWTWALIHAGMVLFAAVGQVIGWRHAELAQAQATRLDTELAVAQASRQVSYSRIYVNLARRNQSLLHRQMAVIDELEEHEEDPDVLQRLFALDHLTTRVRRNAESLLVMAGEDSPRRWSVPVPLSDIARAAASEIEQYERADVRVSDPVSVSGPVVVDLTHLLAELIENAAEYSSPASMVLVGGYATASGAVVTVEDHGIGMSQDDLDAANRTLADPPELDEEIVRQLGFQVVGRLARKLHLSVYLRPTVGGGITAVVEIPIRLLAQDAAMGAPSAEVDLAEWSIEQLDRAPIAEAAPLPSAPAPAALAPAPVPAPVPPAPAAAPAPASVGDSGDPAMLFFAKQPPSAAPDTSEPATDTPAGATPLPSANGRATRRSNRNGHTIGVQQVLAERSSARRHERAGASDPAPAAPKPRSGALRSVPSEPTPAPARAVPSEPTAAPARGVPSAPVAEAAPANQLPQRTPAASLAPGLRDATLDDRRPPGPTPPGSDPEARQALSAFQAAARAARGDDRTMEQGR